MDFSGQVILAFLEEDDEKRVLFRVRPLLTCHGPVTQEEIESLPKEGFLRIAPDQKEQHTFKERMRTLGTLCLLDLRQSTEAMGKVRPNKNYGALRGDRHRYIIYSDAVQDLTGETLYEVVPEGGRVSPLTPRYYLRAGGRIQGPYCSGEEPSCPARHSLPPDNDHLFFVELPDGTSRMFYWPEDVAKEEEDQAGAEVFSTRLDTKTAGVDQENQPDPQEDARPAETVQADPVLEAPHLKDAQEAAIAPWFLEAAAGFHGLLKDTGFALDAVEAERLLLLALVAPRLNLLSTHAADGWLAADVIARAFMWRGPKARRLHEKNLGDRLVFSGETQHTKEGRERFHRAPYATFRIQPGSQWTLPQENELRLDFDQLQQNLKETRQELTEDTHKRLLDLEEQARQQGQGLPLTLKRQVVAFVSLAAALTKGGQKEALSVAALAWLAPYLQQHETSGEEQA